MCSVFFFQAEDGIRDAQESRGLGDVYKRQFDWSVDKRNVTSYTKEEKEKYDKVYENTFVQLNLSLIHI